MAVIGQKGTYAQVQAPKDYLGNALSNIEQTNFRYREEKRQQEQLEQAQRESAEKEQMARDERAYQERKDIKIPEYGVSEMQVSATEEINKLGDRIAELRRKPKTSSQENAEIQAIYGHIDMMKNSATNIKNFVERVGKMQVEEKINNAVYEDDLVPSLLNIKKGKMFFENGQAYLKVIDPDDPNKVTVESLEKLSDPSYLNSLVTEKVNIYDKNGAKEQLETILKPKEYKSDTGIQRKILPEQELAADDYIINLLATQNEKKTKDILQQLRIDHNWKTPEEKQAKIKLAGEKLKQEAKAGLNTLSDKETDDQGENLRLRKSEIAYDRANPKTSGGTTQQSPLSTKVPKTGVNAYNIKVAKGDTQSTVIKAKGKGSLIDTVVFQPRKGGKSDFVLGGFQTPKLELLTEKGKQVLIELGASALEDDYKKNYIDQGKSRFRKISYKQTPELFLAELRKLESLNGGNYTSMEQFKKEMFPNAMPKATQSAPKTKATPKATTKKTIKGFQ